MIRSILNFFGFSKKEKADGDLALFFEEIKNRKIYKKLTIDILDSTPDDQLLQTVFDNLWENLPKTYEDEFYHITNKFNTSQQAIYLIWCLEAEINNGGFNQYYFNNTGRYAHLVPQLLELINAKMLAKLVLEADEIFRSEKEKITEKQDGTLEGFSQSYENNPLNKYDDEFYERYKKEDLQQKQIDFIRLNKTDFIN